MLAEIKEMIKSCGGIGIENRMKMLCCLSVCVALCLCTVPVVHVLMCER